MAFFAYSIYEVKDMQVLVGILAAFGLLCALWCIFGLWLSGSKGWVAVCFAGKGQTGALRRCRWLRSWGLHRGRILLITPEGTQPEAVSRETENIELCTLAELPARLELELTYARIADLTGHRGGGGISKL